MSASSIWKQFLFCFKMMRSMSSISRIVAVQFWRPRTTLDRILRVFILNAATPELNLRFLSVYFFLFFIFVFSLSLSSLVFCVVDHAFAKELFYCPSLSYFYPLERCMDVPSSSLSCVGVCFMSLLCIPGTRSPIIKTSVKHDGHRDHDLPSDACAY
mmetsp:Transcript_15937/g.47877  ORF Transcript_15937/g.47877 Transcript_15937/m.47877 type:complete len:157 (+) Transcript_15937:1575-2045(+)